MGAAREYFEAARDAVRARRRCLGRIAAMRESEGLGGHPVPGGGRGGAGDPMRPVDARIDAEEAALAEVRALEAVIRDAESVCEGVRSANPRMRWGDELYSRYVMDLTWERVAEACAVSVRTAQADVAAALDWVDAVGIAAARSGTGAAERG